MIAFDKATSGLVAIQDIVFSGLLCTEVWAENLKPSCAEFTDAPSRCDYHRPADDVESLHAAVDFDQGLFP